MSDLNDNKLEKALTNAWGMPAAADFDAWQRRHPEAVACLSPQRFHARIQRRKRMRRILISTATAAAVICAWLGIGLVGNSGSSSSAFAQAVEQIQKAKTVTWTTTFYERVKSKDGTKVWIETEKRERAYKAPGLLRETYFDKDLQVRGVSVLDPGQMKRLSYSILEKTATIKQMASWECDGGNCGPFDWALKELRNANLQWVETRKTPNGKVNVFRHAFKSEMNGRDWSYDFWIDQKTKKLVEVHVPGADVFDPETDPDRNNPPGESSLRTVSAHKDTDIHYDVPLDDSLFSLNPPKGYTVEFQAGPAKASEKEMIDYLGVMAEYNERVFPDEPDIPSHRTNKSWAKSEVDRSPTEQKLIETLDHYMSAGQNRLPFYEFTEDNAEANSVRYLGKGVKLGDKDAIVCWYRLKDAKDPRTYRVVYGDLSVKDVPAKDLPLPVEP